MSDQLTTRWEEFSKLPQNREISTYPDRPARVSHRDSVDSNYELECPRCKHSLTGIPDSCCPECGLLVDYEPVKVFTAYDQSLVWVAAMLMDEHQISNMVNVGSFQVFGGVFEKRKQMPCVEVPFKFFHEAVDLLERKFGKRHFKAGEQPKRPDDTPDWLCPNCREENPGSFEVCWNCGADRAE